MSNKLFDECIEALGSQTKIFSRDESKAIFESFEFVYPITQWGRIDWDKVEKKMSLNSVLEVNKALSDLEVTPNGAVFVLWNYWEVPVFKSDLSKLQKAIDDVVVSDTWFFNPIENYVIEFYHDGESTVGRGKQAIEFIKQKYNDLVALQASVKVESYPGFELNKIGSQINAILSKLLRNEKLTDAECVFLNAQHLYSSAWLCSDGKKYPLIKEPLLLEYAKMIENLKKQCKGMIAYNKSVELLQNS